MGKHPVTLLELLVPPAPPDRRRVVYESRQPSVGIALAVNSGSGAAGGPGGHLSGTGGV